MSSEVEIKKLEASLMYKEKNIVVAYLLWFFLGGLGAHRFYLGKTGTAVAQLLLCVIGYITVALIIGMPLLVVFGIWWLLDAYFVNKITTEHNDEMIRKKMNFLKASNETKKEVVETVEEVNEKE